MQSAFKLACGHIPLQSASVDQTLQNFVQLIESGKGSVIDVTTVDGQAQALDCLMQLMRYCADPQTMPKGLHHHSAFFAFVRAEQFCTALFVNLHEDLSLKAEATFLCGLSFIVKCVHCRRSREVVHRLLGTLQIRFPILKERHDTAISTFIEEFFRRTIGEFLDQHENAITHLQKTFPFLYELFVVPLSSVLDRKLFNFYCNPWVYHPIMRYLEYCAQLASTTINRRLLEGPLQWLEGHLQTIHGRPTVESWAELTKKAHKLCDHSFKLEQFANACIGLLGEIKTAAQWDAKDVVLFLPERSGQGRNCDLLVIRPTGSKELIECKAKTPRHGVDEKTAGGVQIWDDFFTNFNGAIHSYLTYLQKTIQPLMGFTECFPLLAAHEGSSYAQALPLIYEIPSTIGNIPLKKWTAEQKLEHLLRALFLRPLILDTGCGSLPSYEDRLIQRQRATEAAIKNKDWIISILNKATKQLEETQSRLAAEGQIIAKLYVALDLDLSCRLLRDPFSYDDGNVAKVAERALHETFEPYKVAFAKKKLDLCLLIIRARNTGN